MMGAEEFFGDLPSMTARRGVLASGVMCPAECWPFMINRKFIIYHKYRQCACRFSENPSLQEEKIDSSSCVRYKGKKRCLTAISITFSVNATMREEHENRNLLFFRNREHGSRVQVV